MTCRLDIIQPLCDAHLSFGFTEGPVSGHYDWHSHEHHQVVYALTGTVRIEAEGRCFPVPPRSAAWIEAGTLHRTTARDALTGSIFLTPRLVMHRAPAVRIVAAPPLLTEMIRHAAHQWPHTCTATAEERSRYFTVFADLLPERQQHPLDLSLPTTRHPQIGAALDYVHANPATARLEEAAAIANMSVRTFRRRLGGELGLRWRDCITQVRLHAAMDRLLSRPEESITTVALSVGFASSSAFTDAFRRFTLVTPTAFRRICAGQEEPRC